MLTSNHDDGRNNCEEKIYGHDLPPPCRRGGHQASLRRSPLSLQQLGQALLWPHQSQGGLKKSVFETEK